jgi:hypothetical protein
MNIGAIGEIKEEEDQHLEFKTRKSTILVLSLYPTWGHSRKDECLEAV